MKLIEANITEDYLSYSDFTYDCYLYLTTIDTSKH